ncbi:tRNA preQ1(34) S-adenosylmethionine ribosyltransferase-isomerase QueA [Aphanizomenon flos-aquae NRERC-008]|jgi:S-adenosylmethionine:tRNA ribosyltransferase-isomerase|uniref:S-adenosylmethionine:tRNA ribosyltransferase-isomerase n=1 Tax=Aphanizomenon flos-aquae FACHB-1249 TaxID=2692889 RepID=A0ABR8ITD7_APHFL|nr:MULTISPECIES: tRNA preQ1(34) S-adenosylmethionine ribosyltransferase-isomerase QueA [Aphanizomenon]MBD2390202.1 tRNA preQ1(34) S-adenosylmethionine ribosyltransferase-isomerase QueA [Aphanizomenon flos-aquae FACHB-1171]MBD2555787.1 tRNA preQ1(34) S-adenosylmethionine ribosyltransferase-isomerase QueA [Aphanizomenon flos-aquae FACHB-1290]MBD2631848.1 tRNA preQ1(34) S-adenosylmethionine ribosyltransferase-isomerase QueA [Aphanizomenon sp. FACHB-1399]MBD2642714.1 tRNA preQ1(34) S-adenosylmethio
MKQQILQNQTQLEAANDINLDCLLSSYDYELPPELIAQNPAVPRDSSKLLVVNSAETGKTIPPLHHIFRDLSELLKPGDLLVMNNTKVIPARLYGCRSTGAEVEVLLLEERRHNCWLALVKPGKRFKVGSEIIFTAVGDGEKQELRATVVESDPETGGRLLQFDLPPEVPLVQVLGKFGQIPLPPYITASTAADEQYQTVYAQEQGAIAAPTAGLHFTPSLLEKLRNYGINQAFITLHVGIGTFRPVEVKDVTNHVMHKEWIEVSSDTVEQVLATRAAGGRIIAVGTTAVRALEGAAQLGALQPFVGQTNLFIYPGYKWQVVEGLITNFHLPRSSLLMLVSALIGRKRLLDLYEQAIAAQYRFYSFGDAMLILPEGKNIQ